MAFKMCILTCDVSKDGNLSMSRLGAIDSKLHSDLDQ